jgi:hypothetical protein
VDESREQIGKWRKWCNENRRHPQYGGAIQDIQSYAPHNLAIVIEAAVAAARAEQGSPWVECAECLPKLGEWVDVAVLGVVQNMPARLEGDYWEWVDDAADGAPIEAISHWRPRPAPPVAEQKGTQNG